MLPTLSQILFLCMLYIQPLFDLFAVNHPADTFISLSRAGSSFPGLHLGPARDEAVRQRPPSS